VNRLTDFDTGAGVVGVVETADFDRPLHLQAVVFVVVVMVVGSDATNKAAIVPLQAQTAETVISTISVRAPPRLRPARFQDL
jgi:hypothetical protein